MATMDVMPPHVAELALQHAPWLRRLALSLVNDPEAAEDLVQETWVRMLEEPPPRADPRGPRAWLATVLRNLARKRWRREELALWLERERARERESPSPDERLALHRELVEAVEALPAHEREAILLRYFEELTPRAIAARLGLPVRTVHTRLHRGLKSLRARLDRRHGDRRSWVLAFVPLLDEGELSTVLATGGLLMGGKVTMGVLGAALCLVAGLLGWRALHEADTVGGAAAQGDAVASAVVSQGTSSDEGSPSPAQAAPSGQRAALPEPEPAAVELPRLRGRAVLADGSPVAGLPVRFVPISAHRSEDAHAALGVPAPEGVEAPDIFRALTDETGAFEIAVDRRGTIECEDPAFATLITPNASDSNDYARASDPVLVVAPNGPLAGRVVDPEGAPLVAVGLQLELPSELHARVGLVFGQSEFSAFYAQTDAEGAFRLDPRPVVEGALLRLGHEDYQGRELEPPGEGREGWEIVLQPKAAPEGVLRGIVRDGEGNPIDGASVALGERLTKTEEGEFHFRLNEVRDRSRLLAVKAGYAPVSLEGVRSAEGWEWPDYVELVLAGEPASIEGVVLDAQDRPVAGAYVWVEDPTRLGLRGKIPLHVEHTLAEDDLLWLKVLTDAEGRFRHAGLMERPYTFRAGNPRTAAWTPPVLVEPGESPVLRFEAGATVPLEGRVVDTSGRPLEGVNLAIQRVAYELLDTEGMGYISQLRGEFATTDAKGRFRFEAVPRGGCELRLNGPDVVDQEEWLEVSSTPEPLTLVALRQCHLRIEVQTADLEADEVALLDGAGEPVIARRMVRDAIYYSPTAPLEDGQQTLTVPETATTAVFRSEGREVLRLPVSLNPGEVTLLQP